jgi:hypothetical protein
LAVGKEARMAEGTPRWVKVFAIVGFALFLLFLVLHLTGNGMGSHGLHGGGP